MIKLPQKLSEKYDSKAIEKKWQNYWREKKIFAWKNDLPKEQTFVIDTPPPTVSGLLHMGHVFSYTQADFVARFQRMLGKDVFYPIGFDDNGLPTERLVEKVIGKKAGVFEAENGRGSFVAKCREVVEEAEKEFEAMFNSIALSVDWEQKYQTISPESQKISQASFVDLYSKGLVERKFEPVFWDISDRTALAQADLVDKEMPGMMNEIEFGIEGSDEKIVIMTTRPEMLPACVAVMIKKNGVWSKFAGKKAITPLFGVKVPIIEVDDDSVKEDKGTGAVMCCTFGDETDIRWWKKHNLPLRVIIGKDGKIDELSIKQTKEKITADLQTKNLLRKQTPITHSVKCAERSGVPIEILVAPQWFVKILDKKEQLKAKANECEWFPDYMRIRIEQWIDGLSWDWCISRQRFFGVPFPIWYSKRAGEEGKVLVAEIDQLPCDPVKDLPRGYSREEVTAETDIMDTWATSSISPQLSSHGISEEISFDKARHQKLFPADLRPQAHEIIRTWAFYTITKSLLHQNSVPWKNLMISGWCLAADKTKMSKSKGNVVTPTSLIEEKGSDIVRYWASTSHLGADTAYSEEVFKIGQKLITKLFNAAKFISHISTLSLEGRGQGEGGKITEAADLWILSKLQQTIKRATESFEIFEYARAREAIEEFFWKDFCDNYLEICKVRAYGLAAEKLAGIEFSDEEKAKILAKQQSAITTLEICLNRLLKLFAPFIPHICDEIFSIIFAEEFEKFGSVNARGTWPKSAFVTPLYDGVDLQKFHDIGEAALAVIFEVRKFKSEKNLSMKVPVKKLIIICGQDLSAIRQDLENVCNVVEPIEFKNGQESLVEVIL